MCLSDWVETLPSPHHYFNFIASHDGIGLLPAEGILDREDIDNLIAQTEAHGGLLSYKTDTEGKRQVYELNITLYDFLNDPAHPQPKLDTARYLTSQIIMLELAGVPGVYVHSLFGSGNCAECYRETGRARSVNRQKFEVDQLKLDLADGERSGRILNEYLRLAGLRSGHSAFSPQADQSVLFLEERVFALLRHNRAGGERILCLSNLTADALTFQLDFSAIGLQPPQEKIRDLIAEETFILGEGSSLSIKMEAYQSRWLLIE